MSSKPPRHFSSEKDPELNVFVEKNFSTNQNTSNLSELQPAIHQSFEIELEKALLPYFKDLIGLDLILERLTKSLTVFLSRTDHNCCFNLWSGKTLTGKTSLAKRLSGHEGFAPFAYKGIKATYLDCFAVHSRFDKFKEEWADPAKSPNNSVLFIDEAEKLLDAKHGLVDDVFAKKFRKLLEDLSRSRKLYFIFLSQEPSARDNVFRLFDTKLTSLIDFGFKFPEWTMQNLLNTILETVHSKGYKIEPAAAAELATHASQHGMVLELQGVLQLLELELKRNGKSLITESQVKNVLQMRG